MKGRKGTLGKPLYKCGDTVSFDFGFSGSDKTVRLTGKVCIVDAYGTFEQNEEPSYDVEAPYLDENMELSTKTALYKHLRESFIIPPKGED